MQVLRCAGDDYYDEKLRLKIVREEGFYASGSYCGGYRQGGPKKPHIVIVNKLMAEENNMDRKRTGLIGRSKDEENRDYILPPGLIEKQYGGVKHKVWERSKDQPLDRKTLTNLIDDTNYVILEEACMVGEKMILKRDILKGSSPVERMINLPQ